MEDKTDLCA